MNRTRAEELASIFERLARDARIDPCPFRLWHTIYLFHDHRSGKAWPGIRTLARIMHSRTGHISKWLARLEANGWLQIERATPPASNVYLLLDGRGKPLPRRETHVPQKGDTHVPQKGFLTSPKKGTEPIPPKGGEEHKRPPSAAAAGAVAPPRRGVRRRQQPDDDDDDDLTPPPIREGDINSWT